MYVILKDLYLLRKELENVRSFAVQFKRWGKACTTNTCNQSQGALNASRFGLQQLEEIELFCFHGSLS